MKRGEILRLGLWGGPMLFDWHCPHDPLYREGGHHEWWLKLGDGYLQTYASRRLAVSDARYQIAAYARYGVEVTRELYRLVPGVGFILEETWRTSDTGSPARQIAAG